MKCPNCGETKLVRIHVQQVGPEYRASGKLMPSVDVESLPGTPALMMFQTGVIGAGEHWEYIDEDEEKQEDHLIIQNVYCGRCGELIAE